MKKKRVTADAAGKNDKQQAGNLRVTYRLYLPGGESAEITTRGDTPLACLMAAFCLAGKEYPQWRGIEGIRRDETRYDEGTE